MADEKTAEEIAAEKVATDKAAAEKKEKEEAGAKEAAKRKVKIEDGKVILDEQDYNNLVGIKEDLAPWKQRAREAEAKIEADTKAKLEADEKALKEKGEFKELAEKKEAENKKLIEDMKNNKIDSAIKLKAFEAGINKSEYVKLLDKSGITIDETSGEVVGIDEVLESFKTDNPDLFGSGEAAPGVVTSRGGSKSGIVTDADLIKYTGTQLMDIKKNDSALYARWMKLSAHGQPIPERNEEKKE